MAYSSNSSGVILKESHIPSGEINVKYFGHPDHLDQLVPGNRKK